MGPDETSIDEILNLINNARSNVNPSAASIPTIRWDTRLARIAQKKSENCQDVLNSQSCEMVLNLGPSVYVRQHSHLSHDTIFDWTDFINSDLDSRTYFTYGESNRGFGLFKILSYIFVT